MELSYLIHSFLIYNTTKELLNSLDSEIIENFLPRIVNASSVVEERRLSNRAVFPNMGPTPHREII